jgi:hypothetical protein
MAQLTNIRVRRDSASNWTTTNPVLGSGEFGLETGTNLLKIGDGAKTWTTLPYLTNTQAIRKASDTPRASTTAFTNDPDLVATGLANTAYTFRMQLYFFCTSAAPDAKVQVTGPAGATARATVSINGLLAPVQLPTINTSSGLIALTASTVLSVDVMGSILIGGTAGTWGLQWAQNASNVAAVNLQAGSSMEIIRI